MGKLPSNSLKFCDHCERQQNEVNPVRSYRWMRIMDNLDYKHNIILKIDLCYTCHEKVMESFKPILKTLRYGL